MYSLKAFLSKTPIQITGAVMAVVNLAIISGWWDIAAKTVSGLNVALIAVLGLFVTSNTVNSAKLAELNSALPDPDPVDGAIVNKEQQVVVPAPAPKKRATGTKPKN